MLLQRRSVSRCESRAKGRTAQCNPRPAARGRSEEGVHAFSEIGLGGAADHSLCPRHRLAGTGDDQLYAGGSRRRGGAAPDLHAAETGPGASGAVRFTRRGLACAECAYAIRARLALCSRQRIGHEVPFAARTGRTARVRSGYRERSARAQGRPARCVSCSQRCWASRPLSRSQAFQRVCSLGLVE